MPSFNIHDDNEKIKTGQYFWCSGCLGAIPVAEQSPDVRYCQFCYKLLCDEVKILKETGHFSKAATWTPIIPKEHSKQGDKTALKHSPDTMPQGTVMLPINGMSNKTPATLSATATPTTPTRPANDKGGRPRRALPMDKINELHNDGMGVKAIGRQLGLSGMTVSRALAGVK